MLLGSASPDLVRASSESLAGRIAYYPLGGFRISEVGVTGDREYPLGDKITATPLWKFPVLRG